MNPRENLFKQLLKVGLVDPSQNDQTLLDPCRPDPIRYLSSKGIFAENKALELISKRLALDIISFDPSVTERIEESSLFKAVDPKILWSNKVLPLWEENSSIVVAFANPCNLEVKQTLEFSFSRTVKQYLAKEDEILSFLSTYYPIDTDSYDELTDITEDSYVEVVDSAESDEAIDTKNATTPPIVRLINMILSDAIKARASDIHIEPAQSSMDVRFRVDGKMQHFLDIPKRLQSYAISRVKLLSGMDISERRKPQDGRFRVRIGDDLIDFRTSSVPSVHGEAVVLRVLNTSGKVLSFKELGLNEELSRKINDSLEKDSRMLLVTGPTGSGKTTTLYSCLLTLNDKTRNIISVENPIEYRLKGITQIQVNEAKNVTFASSLRSILRQDPDVIMIGEIRDEETANIAVESAMTGHKVLSTVHTNDAPSAITRLNHLGLSYYNISCAISGILAQRLVRKVCKSCSTKLSDKQLQQYASDITQFKIKVDNLRTGKGCEKCSGTGYYGRTGIYSFLEIDDKVVKLLEAEAPLSKIIEYARSAGYKDLASAAIEVVNSGLTTLDEVHPYLDATGQTTTEVNEKPPTIGLISTKNLKLNNATPGSNIEGIQKTKILIVEDDPDVRFMLKTLFEREFYDVKVAENGLVALESVYNRTPAIILCDLKMPVMDGREFMKKLRSKPQTQELPVVILTASDDEKSEIDALDLGAKDFISKASSSELMLARVRRALGDID